MNTHRLDVSDFEHTQPGVTHCWPDPDEPVRIKWMPLIFALIAAGVGGYAWVFFHSA